MTEVELLTDILAVLEAQQGELESIIFLLQACCTGLGFLAAAALLAGWLYCRRDGDF